jgi:hypothetical protein
MTDYLVFLASNAVIYGIPGYLGLRLWAWATGREW